MNKKYYTLIKSLLFTVLLLTFIPAQSQGVDEQYRQTIESADGYFDKADYLNAKASYQIASQLKPDEQYPKDRLKESISLLRVQLEQMADYNEKLAYADRLYDEKSWANAILAYEEALKIMPSQEYPGDQIALIQRIQSDEADNESSYAALLQDGDVLFAAGDYTAALAKYEEASLIYPGRQDVNDKLSAVDQKLSEAVEQQTGYEKSISEAERYHARKDYENELLSYQKAMELKPEEPLPQVKIRELNEFLRKYEAYNKFVTEGDNLYIAQQFAEAKLKYESALEILPDENYPKEIISKVNVALSEKTERDKAAYDEAIARADELYIQEDYDDAMIAYSDALRFWPDGDYARERLSSISEIMALRKAKEEAYANSITLADKLFANKEYSEARTEYRKAADINPFEQYPKVRIDEIDMILAEIKSLLDQYDQVIQGADKLFNVGDYAQARIQYLRAQDLLSDRSYPEDQIKMIDEILGLEQATQEAYDAAIARGDEHFTTREWEDAKVDYSEANDLIPEEQYPKDKITEINNILAQLQAEQETYTLALKTADQLFADNDYIGALLEYRKAADIFTEEEYPQQKIEEINTLLAEQARLQGIDQSYNDAIAEGDRLMGEEQFAASKASFELALTFKADELYPKDKIAEIDGILAELARLQGIEESYNEAIDIAEQSMGQEDYNKAKTDYQRASDIKPDEQYPKDKIAEIDAIFAAEAARLAQLGAEYSQAITDADALFASMDYSGARNKYNAALVLMPDEAYPAGKITEIDGILGEQERQRLLDEEYANTIATADGLYTDESYSNAKSEYEKAVGLKPDEQYPKDKISEIDDIFAEQARLLGIEESYATAISDADGFLLAGQYNEAKAEYTKASGIKSEEEYPKQKISEIDTILAGIAAQQTLDDAYGAAISKADGLFGAQNYVDAKAAYVEASGIKPEETYPIEKASEIDNILAEQARLAELNEEYQIAIGTADNYYNTQQYAEAKEAYVRAQGIKADEPYPVERITEIDHILANIEEQRLIDEGYANAIALGDNHFDNKEYTEAIADYGQALTFKAGQQYPKDRISEIDGILSEEARLQQIEEDYNNAITSADGFFAAEQYVDAKAAYYEAVVAKPGDAYATGKVTEIDGILTEMNRLQEIEDNYNNAIAAADAAFAAANYQAAKDAYTSALGIKPGEEYPASKLTEITGLLDEQAMLLAIDAQYDKAISSADSLFLLQEYESASEIYLQALEIKAGETYPQQKIDDINRILEEIAAQKAIDDNYAEAIVNADEFLNRGAYMEALQEYNKAAGIKPDELYPKEKITEINNSLAELEEERQKAYNTAIAQADSYYNMGNYRNAKSAYQTAVDIKPDEQYARNRLDEVTVIYMAELESLKVEYRKFIADADNYFNEKIYDGAIENYRIAAGYLPDEPYPGQMIARISKIINDNAITDVNKLAQIIPNNTDRRFPFNELPVNVRKANYILIKARNVSDHDFKMLVNFGKDDSKNGGVVLQVPKGDVSREYLIRIGALYRWFSEDNNWLGIYPEGGDIEVALIRISKSD